VDLEPTFVVKALVSKLQASSRTNENDPAEIIVDRAIEVDSKLYDLYERTKDSISNEVLVYEYL